MAVSLALLVAAGGLGLSATPVRADHTITVSEAVAAQNCHPMSLLRSSITPSCPTRRNRSGPSHFRRC